jgi:ferrous iron transport protein B
MTAANVRPQQRIVALLGRPNSGKSSLYNRLTGGNARVGNYPGITVDVLESDLELPSGSAVRVADLPGLYSVEANVGHETDEAVARRFLDRARNESSALLVVQVVDPTRLALGLRLTRELASAGVPVTIALTHADVLAAEGRAIDVALLEERLGVKVVLVDARSAAAKPSLLAAIDDALRLACVPSTSFDPTVLAADVVVSKGAPRTTTARFDAILLHPVLGPFFFLGLMALVFAAVFLVADPVSSAFDRLVALARTWLDAKLGGGLLASFVADGMLAGSGTVLAFMPQIVILTVALELLEASGYLARGAFLVDRVLRVLGLSGRSFVPLLMGHACAVPAISATRVVRDPRERLTTILVLPLMTCSARLPTYGLVLATFFAGRSALFRSGLFVALYFSGILFALLASAVLRRTATRGKSLPLVLEMPSYRLPQASVVARKAYRTSTRFLRDVGTIILVVSCCLWVLLRVPMPGSHAEGPPIERSIAGAIGRTLEPLTRPAGFDWKIDIGLIASFGARETMVATMGVVYGVEDAEDDTAPLAQKLRDAKHPDGTPRYGVPTALALLAFFALACQCMSTVAAIRRETRSWRWPALVLAYTYALGYGVAVVVYQVAGFLGVS